MFNPGRRLARKEILKHIPTGPEWFSPESVKSGQVGLLLKSIADQVGDWLNAIYGSQEGLYLLTATGEDLDKWGADIGVTRRLEEDDESFRARISKSVLRPRLTKESLEQLVKDELGLDTEIFLPWEHLDWRSADPSGGTIPGRGRSGSRRRANHYYTSGTIDVITQGWNKETKTLINDSKAAPIKPYFTAILQNGLVEIVEPVMAGERLVLRVTFVPLVPVGRVRGRGLLRSGARETLADKIFMFGHLALHLYPETEAFGILEKARDRVTYAEQVYPDTYYRSETLIGIGFTVIDTSAEPIRDVTIFRDLTGSALSYGYDRPNETSMSFWDTSVTWGSVIDKTWDELIGPRDAQGTANIVLAP